MALTAAQIAAIKRQVPKNAATRAALIAKKISNVEAGAAAEKMSKGVSSRARSIDANFKGAMSPSAKAADAAQQKKNADLEKHRRFAKGEKPMAPKTRVGTKAEYKALGKEINVKAELHKKATAIENKKAALAAANPVTETRPTPKKAAPVKKAAAAKSAPVKSTPKSTASEGSPINPKIDVTPEEHKGAKKMVRAMKKEDKVRAKSGTGVAKTPQTLEQAKASAPKPKIAGRPAVAAQEAKAASEALKAKEVARGVKEVSTVAKAGKVAGALGKVAKFASKRSVYGTAAMIGAPIVLNKLNAISTPGKMPAGGKGTSGRGGHAQGWVPDKKVATTPQAKKVADKVTSKGAGVSGPGSKTSGGTYRVSSGDTLSGIASRAGVSLADLRSVNPKLDGKGIFRNTPVKIPKSGKMPSGGYTGSVPYKGK